MEFNNNMPIYIQVIMDIKKQIVNGKMELGSKMLSARDLAILYQINPNTCNRIYKELEQEEVCFTKRGLGTFVTENSEKVKEMKEEMAENSLQNFIREMKDISFSKEEVIKLIEEKYENME